MINPRNPYGRGHSQMNKAREQMLIDRYTVAMVELKMAGAGEHVINRYRTITPKVMRKMLPDIRYEIERYEAGTAAEQQWGADWVDFGTTATHVVYRDGVPYFAKVEWQDMVKP
jgi:hypothetical protein